MKIFISTGPLPSSLIISKLTSMAQLQEINKIVLFCVDQQINIPKCELRRIRLLNNGKRNFLNTLIKIFGTFFLIVKESIKNGRPDIYIGILSLPYGLIAFLCGKIFRRPVFVNMIGGTVELETYYPVKFFWKNLNLWFLKRCERIITTGQRVTNNLVKHGIPRQKIFETPGSIDINLSTDIPRDLDILYVGQFIPNKGPDRFVKIINSLKKEIPNIKAVMLGNGPLWRETKLLIEKLDLQDCIDLPGYVTDVQNYCSRSKIFLLPTKTEGLSVAMMEAMASGAIPVVPDVGNLTDGAKHGINSLVVKTYDDLHAYVDFAKRLLVDEGYRKELSNNAKAFAVANWSYDADGLHWKEILSSLR